jgi:nicotinamidase-related amidase
VATQDFHPKDHVSFASNHQPPFNKPFESFIDVKNLLGSKPEQTMKQRLWPVHCVQGTKGCDLLDELDSGKVDFVVKKGMDSEVEMYSAFADSFGNRTAGTGSVSHDLASELKSRGILHVYVVGLAGDYCVRDTAVGAARAGFTTYVIEEGQRCVDPNTWNDVKESLRQNSVSVVSISGSEVARVLGP